jgi:uncharacterized protein (TIGR02117 family)
MRLAAILAAWLVAAGALADGARTIHVVSNGWHAGIVVSRGDWPPGRTPELADLAGAFVEIGWGDREYYPASSPTILMAIAAGLGANDSVIHLAPREAAPRAGGGLEVQQLALSENGFRAMAERIDAAFDRADGAKAAVVAPGLRPGAVFYAATGRFSLANTCNTWVARMLEAGGVAIAPGSIVTADELMARLRALPAPATQRP